MRGSGGAVGSGCGGRYVGGAGAPRVGTLGFYRCGVWFGPRLCVVTASALTVRLIPSSLVPDAVGLGNQLGGDRLVTHRAVGLGAEGLRLNRLYCCATGVVPKRGVGTRQGPVSAAGWVDRRWFGAGRCTCCGWVVALAPWAVAQGCGCPGEPSGFGAVRRTASAALGSPRRDASPSPGPSRLLRGVPPRVAFTLRRRGTPRRPGPAAPHSTPVWACRITRVAGRVIGGRWSSLSRLSWAGWGWCRWG